MTLDDQNEASGIIANMMTALQASVPSSVGRPASAFRLAVGDLLASSAIYLQAGALGTPLLTVSRWRSPRRPRSLAWTGSARPWKP